jgi:hypothetical protein
MESKSLTVPVSTKTTTATSVQLWEVRWRSRHGAFSGDLRPEVECFTSEEAADEFATSLRNAFKLIRNTSRDDIGVTVEKSKQGS